MIDIKNAGHDNADFLTLIDKLNVEFVEMYGTSKEKFPGENKLDERTKVVVLYDESEPVACGALKPMASAGMGELKRMFVLKAHRGQGLSKMILSALEALAKESGYKTLRLKTGKKQVAAINLYAQAGYLHIEPYGGYRDIPDSVCMEKVLPSEG